MRSQKPLINRCIFLCPICLHLQIYINFNCIATLILNHSSNCISTTLLEISRSTSYKQWNIQARESHSQIIIAQKTITDVQFRTLLFQPFVKLPRTNPNDSQLNSVLLFLCCTRLKRRKWAISCNVISIKMLEFSHQKTILIEWFICDNFVRIECQLLSLCCVFLVCARFFNAISAFLSLSYDTNCSLENLAYQFPFIN